MGLLIQRQNELLEMHGDHGAEMSCIALELQKCAQQKERERVLEASFLTASLQFEKRLEERAAASALQLGLQKAHAAARPPALSSLPPLL